MFQLGIARTSASTPAVRGGKMVRSGLGGLVALLLTAVLAAPVRAQAPAQAASGSGTRAQTSVKPGKVKQPANSSRQGSNSSRTNRRGADTIALPTRVVLVFPTDTKGGISDQLSDVITDTVQGRLSASGQYQSIYFLRSIPTVQRALTEAALTPNEVAHPYDDDTKLKKLMPVTGYNLALTTSIDSYTYDEKKNQVTMLISARLIDFSGSKPIVRAAAENGSSPENGGNTKEITLALRVAKELSEKLMTSLLAPTRSTTMAAPTPASGASSASNTK